MDTIAETIKFAGFGKKKAMAKQIQMFDDRLTDQGETLLAVCASVKGIKTSAKEEKDMYDVTDVIRELKELLEDELISQGEFDAKKKQLLGI